MNRIIVAGCSYSVDNDYTKVLSKYYINADIINLAKDGNSNDKIIKDVYDFANKENVENCLFICQLTYLHRLGFYHSSINRWLDYQPSFIFNTPKIVDNKIEFGFHKKLTNFLFFEKDVVKNNIIANKLKDMYETYLSYVYDDEQNFDRMIQQIDFLQSYIESKNAKILYIYWPDIKNDTELYKLKSRNFFHINENYSMLDYSVRNNLVKTYDSHLSPHGSNVLANLLSNHDLFKHIDRFKANII